MAKTRSAEKPEPEDKTDGLELISIGTLYKGPWDKKYWSSSRGKDRYPYPVGYQATRAHNGTTYKMEIHEGVNGPRFVISCDDGNYSGKTPDIALEEFHKRGCSRLKIWHGKRLSSKMDGLELFGFKNPFIQRLLRELVADINGIEQSSSNLCDGISRMEHDDCRPNLGTYPDLLLCLERPQVTRKRSKGSEAKNMKLHGRTLLKRPRPLEVTCSSRASKIKNEGNLHEGSSITHHVLEENEVRNHKGSLASLHAMSSVGESAIFFSSENAFPLNSIGITDEQKGRVVPSERTNGFVDSSNCECTEIAGSLSPEKEFLHRSQDPVMKGSSISVAREDKKPLVLVHKESEVCTGINLYAPDTLDVVQENTSDFAPSALDKVAHSNRAYEITSGDLLSESHQEKVLTSISNPNFEKSDYDLGGQDVAKSMMTVLLPQAIPLLKQVSVSKSAVSPSETLPSGVEEDNKIGIFLDAPSSGVMVTDKALVGDEEEILIHMPRTGLNSIIPSSEHTKSIIPDSFDNNHCEDHKTNEVALSSDVAETGRASFRVSCSPRSKEQLPWNPLANESSMCYFDVNPTKDKFCHVPELDFRDWPQDSNVCIPDSVEDHISPMNRVISERSNDACPNLQDNSVQVGLNSMQGKALMTADNCTGGIDNALSGVNTNGVHLRDLARLAGKTQDEVVGKTENTETMITPSSQEPKLVYTRRKVRNAAPLSENCPLLQRIEFDKVEEVTPVMPTAIQMHTVRGTLPPPETIQMNISGDKPCEPDLSAAKARDEVKSNDLHIDNSVTSSQIKLKPTMAENKILSCASEEKLYTCPDPAVSNEETPQTHGEVQDGHSNSVKLNTPKSFQNPDPKPSRNKEPVNNLGSIVKFVGCYFHPMLVSSLFLSTRENEIHICVLCGLLLDQNRTLFTYKVSTMEPSVGCPSLIACTSILLPDPKQNFTKETVVERSGLQMTPDGQSIVLLGSIKTPNCRERKICCNCSTCTSVCSEENALKIVRVEDGYVSVIATLETVEMVHCILICEPNQLVSVGESGRLLVWAMNSTWSEKIEEFILPANDSISPAIVELKKVPKCAHLVVGRNCFGEFSLWDILKRNCVSNFSASTNSINQFFPISLFQWKTNGPGFTYASVEEQVDKLLGASNLWFSEHRETYSFLPTEEEDIAMWLLVSTSSDFESQHNYVSNYGQIPRDRSWRLALLVKNHIILGSPLDPRTTAIGVSGNHGIISTSDGLVYMWELSRGSKLGTLHHFQDDTGICVATDDSTGGAIGVASGGQLLVYLHHNEPDAN